MEKKHRAFGSVAGDNLAVEHPLLVACVVLRARLRLGEKRR
ncbi:MAG: hypothetical protein ACI9KE_002979 [Polyangiales bacterium]|jgi:hypothetical protein